MFCSSSDGGIYRWNLGSSTPAAIVDSSAPTDNLSILVTEERFIFALGADNNPRLVQWADRESLTDWTVSIQNEAGFIELSTNGQIMTGAENARPSFDFN